MRTKTCARRVRQSSRRRRYTPYASLSPAPDQDQEGNSSQEEVEALVLPGTKFDGDGKKQFRDNGHDAGDEKVVPPVMSPGGCPPDNLCPQSDQLLDKSSCLKCDKGGELLVCSVNECPISTHEKCLNSKPKFDESGSFYCPFCIYKQMVVRVEKLRRKAMLAEKKLTNFLNPGIDERGKEKLEGGIHEVKDLHVHPSPQNKSDDSNNNNKADNDGMLQIQRSKPVNDLHVKSNSDDLSIRHQSKKQMCPCVAGPAVGSFPEGHSSHGCNNKGSVRNRVSDSHTDKETASGDIQDPPRVVPPILPQPLRILASEECPHLPGVSSWKLIKRAPADQSKLQLPHPRKLPEVTLPNVKRKRLYWTPEEEEMLKEGVRLFSSNINKNLPWRKILEYGCHVFDPTRTPSDLKDKWKTMTRSLR